LSFYNVSTVVIENDSIPHCKSGLLAKCTDFQLFPMKKSNKSNWKSSTQQK